MSAALTIILLLSLFVFLHTLHHDASSVIIVSQTITLVGWVSCMCPQLRVPHCTESELHCFAANQIFATLILHREHARALSQTWVLRTWWVLQLLVGTIKLHAFVRYQQAGGHQTIDFFLFILVYTLMVVISLVAFVQRENFPRPSPSNLRRHAAADPQASILHHRGCRYSYSPVSIAPEEAEIGSFAPSKQRRSREVHTSRPPGIALASNPHR